RTGSRPLHPRPPRPSRGYVGREPQGAFHPSCSNGRDTPRSIQSTEWPSVADEPGNPDQGCTPGPVDYSQPRPHFRVDGRLFPSRRFDLCAKHRISSVGHRRMRVLSRGLPRHDVSVSSPHAASRSDLCSSRKDCPVRVARATARRGFAHGAGGQRMSDESVPVSLGKRVDQACDRFEKAWKAGQGPRIEAYVAEVPEPGQTPPLRELLALELELRRSAGERLTPEEYHGRFPEHIELIHAVFADAPGDHYGDPPASSERPTTP